MKPIKFYRGDENHIVVETNRLVDSIFAEQYVKSLILIDNILRTSNEEVPSIVTFCGDRGEGKTSCMKTIVKILENPRYNYVHEFLNEAVLKRDAEGNPTDILLNHCQHLVNTPMDILHMIDPSFFDSEHNVMQLLLGQMFKRFKYEYQRSEERSEEETELLRKLSKSFKRAKACLSQIKQPREKIYDPMEELDALSAAEELKDSMSSLIEDYLSVFCKSDDGQNPSILVVAIDDIDLNIDGAYEMVEQIRKYLVSDRCLLLVSLNVDQLIDVISNYMAKKVTGGIVMDTSTMASKYVTKLIPMDNRIVMPKIYDLCDSPLWLYADATDQDPSQFHSVKEAVVHLIYNKTRYLFYNGKGGVSPIVPNNLRSLRHLLGLLQGMSNFICNEQSISNKHDFKSYFYQTWIHQLNKEDQRFASFLVRGEDSTNVNKLVVSYLASKLPDETKRVETIHDIINPVNFNYNVSVGDVFYLLNYLERSNTDEELRLMLFFIKSFYSIRLYEYYDIITEEMDYLYPKSTIEGEVFKRDAWFNRTNLMQRFVNGSFFTYEVDDVLPMTDNRKVSRDMKVINARFLYNLVSKDIRKNMTNYDSWEDEEVKATFRKKFRIAEFFALTTKKSISQRKAETFTRLRREYNEPFHLSDFNLGTGYLVFDVLAPFYNMLNLKYTYGRFSYMRSETPQNDFYEFAYNHDWSLLRRMMLHVKLKEHNDFLPKEECLTIDSIDAIPEDKLYIALNRLMSNATIRNGEVLSAVFEAIQSRRTNMHNSKDNRGVMIKFYKDIIDSEMRTYRNSVTDAPYVIKFAFLNAIIELLEEEGIESLVHIYESGLEVQETTKEDVLNQFNRFFSSGFKTKKRSAIMSDIEKYNRDTATRISESQWYSYFPDDKKSYSRDYIIETFKKNFVEMTGLMKATELYIEDIEQ